MGGGGGLTSTPCPDVSIGFSDPPVPSYPPRGCTVVFAAAPPTTTIQQRGRSPFPRLPGLGSPRVFGSDVPFHLCAILVFRFTLTNFTNQKYLLETSVFFHRRLQNLSVGEYHGSMCTKDRGNMELEKREITGEVYPPKSGGPKVPN